MVNMMPIYAPKYSAMIPENSKKVSYVRLKWQKYHRYIQFPSKPHFDDIPDLTNHPDGVTK